MLKIEMIVDAKNNLGEGPIWDVAEQKLYWIDSLDRFIHCCNADGKTLKSWAFPTDIGSMALRKSGGAVLALANGSHAFDFGSGDVTLIADSESNSEGRRLNDGKVDQRRRLVAGSMDRTEAEPLGTLYQLGSDREVRVLDEGIVVSNAPCWAPDGRTFADSIRGEIYAYDYDLESGLASNCRLFASARDDPGAPDGGTVDAEGYVECADRWRAYHPLSTRRERQPRDRVSHCDADQLDVRRPKPRYPLCRDYGKAERRRRLREVASDPMRKTHQVRSPLMA